MKPARMVILAVTCLLALPLLAMGALGGSSNEVKSSTQVANELPANVRIEISGDDDASTPGVQVTPTPRGQANFHIVIYAEDGNGWKDLRSANAQVFRPDGSPYTSELKAHPDEGGDARQRAFRAQFEVGGSDAPGTYTVRASVTDREDALASAEAQFTLLELLALSIQGGPLQFGDGQLGPGASSHDKPASVSIRNDGNVRLDLRLTGSPLVTPEGDASIPPDRVRYSAAPDMTGERSLSGDGILDEAFDLAPGDATKPVYFDLHMPTGEEQYLPASLYHGAVTLGGVSG